MEEKDIELKDMELNDDTLEFVTGGLIPQGGGLKPMAGVVDGLHKGYLAVRNSPQGGKKNQIGGLVNGDHVEVLGPMVGGYALVDAYCTQTDYTNETGQQRGWVDVRYIRTNG